MPKEFSENSEIGKIWKEAQISLAKELIALPVDTALAVLEKLASSK